MNFLMRYGTIEMQNFLRPERITESFTKISEKLVHMREKIV